MIGAPYHRALLAVADEATRRSLGRPGRLLQGRAEVRRYKQHRELVDRYGIDARTVLYIGANEGQDLRVLRAAYPRAAVHCFEPQRDVLARLRSVAAAMPDVHVHGCALGATTRTMTMARSLNHHESSSLRRPSTEMAARFPHVGDWVDEPVPVTTLDEWASTQAITDDVVVKMDVQGFEDEVIAGGGAVFSRARIVMTELAVIPTYEDAPDWRRILDAFLERGYVYAGEMDRIYQAETGAVIEFDAAFVRPAVGGDGVRAR